MYDNNGNKINQENEIEFSYDKPKKKSFFNNLFNKKKKEEKQDKKKKVLNIEDNYYKPTYEREIPVVNDELVRKSDSFNIQNSVKKEVTPTPNQDLPNNQFNNSNQNENGMDFSYYFPKPEIKEIKEEPIIEKNTSYIIMGVIVAISFIVIIITLLIKSNKTYELTIGFDTISLRSGESFQIPYYTSDQSQTKFSIENSDIATINSNGFIKTNTIKTDKQYLETKIIVGNGTINKNITLYVIQPNESIAIEDFDVKSTITLYTGEHKMIEIANIKPPYNTHTQKFVFESNDNNIVTVDSIGIITGIKKGETTIKVKNTANLNLNKEIKIIVK